MNLEHQPTTKPLPTDTRRAFPTEAWFRNWIPSHPSYLPPLPGCTDVVVCTSTCSFQPKVGVGLKAMYVCVNVYIYVRDYYMCMCANVCEYVWMYVYSV
jgi:hypothetical protein